MLGEILMYSDSVMYSSDGGLSFASLSASVASGDCLTSAAASMDGFVYVLRSLLVCFSKYVVGCVGTLFCVDTLPSSPDQTWSLEVASVFRVSPA